MGAAGETQGQVYEQVIEAARLVWLVNGCDLLAALWRVSLDDPDRAVRVAAREAFGRAKDVRWVRDVFERAFAKEAR